MPLKYRKMIHLAQGSKAQEVMNKIMHILILYASMLPVVHACSMTMGHFFIEEHFPNSNLMKETIMNDLEPSFHWCSSKEDCNYVVKDTKSGEFNTKGSEVDLPSDKQYLRIWRKIEPGKDILFVNLIYPNNTYFQIHAPPLYP